MEKLILVDGNSIANRAFYALPLLSNSSGLHTNAVYGFTTMLLRLIDEEKPSHFMVAFDAGKVTFRHADYKEYKGGRAKTPPELSEQFPVLKELLAAFRIARFELEGYEADDIIGTLTRMAEAEKMDVLVVTGDKDMLQLASDRVTIALTRKGISEVERYDPPAIQEKYGLKPQQIIDLKGLMGDSSDNIPGVPGVGEKTALKLLHEHPSVEEVLEHADSVKGKLGEKLREHAESARLSKELATIYREVPMDKKWDDLKFGAYDGSALSRLFRELEFKSLLEKFPEASAGGTGTDDKPAAEQEALKWTYADERNLAGFIDKLEQVTGLHVEVTGENPHAGEVLGAAFHADGENWFVPLEILKSDAAAEVRGWLADPQRPKRMYDAHKAQVALSWQGLELNGVVFDVLIASYLLDPTDAALHLSGTAARWTDLKLSHDDEVFGKGAKFHIPEPDVLGEYLCRKAEAICRLVPVLEQELEQIDMHRLFYDLELPLANVLARMELTGIRVDKRDLEKYGEELGDGLQRIMQQIYESAGTEFNINSPKQLGEILFDKLGLPVIKKTKTGPSTNAEVLEKLAPYHDVVAMILQYRQLAKLQSTYVEGLLKEVHVESGKVHTYYRQTIAATGRLSSQFPNLQNIPIRMEEGRKIRKVFVPEDGWKILSADYSQIELRVLAHISGDERLIEAFRQNMDIHTKTAMDVFGVPEEEVDANMRRQAKAVNFGIVYGISDYGLSQNLNITRKEAAAFIEQYFSVFQGVRKFMDDIVKQAREDGYVTTMLQRRRYLPDIRSSNYNMRSFAERTAMNTPIQGTAADIIKLAMVRADRRLKEEKLGSRMLLQVHDELVFEVPQEELETMKAAVAEVMEQALELAVPLKVDINWGDNWYEAK